MGFDSTHYIGNATSAKDGDFQLNLLRLALTNAGNFEANLTKGISI